MLNKQLTKATALNRSYTPPRYTEVDTVPLVLAFSHKASYNWFPNFVEVRKEYQF